MSRQMDGGTISQTNGGPNGPGIATASTDGLLTKSQRLVLGLMILLLVDVIWVSSSELTKYLYTTAAFEKPFFSTYFKNSLFSLYLLGFLFWPPWRDQCYKLNNYLYIDPNGDDDSYFNDAASTLSDPTFEPVKGLSSGGGSESDDSSVRSVRFSRVAEVRQMNEEQATEALIARLSYQASLRAGEAARRAADKLPLRSVARTALTFCFLWFVAQYTYQKSLTGAEAGFAAVLSSTSSVFTLLLSAVFPSGPGDRLTVSKMAAVGLSMAGLGILTLAGVGNNTTYTVTSANTVSMSGTRVSVFLALLSAFFYAAYIVLLRRYADNEEKLDIPQFFGFVGLFNLAFLWPVIFFLDYTRWESLEWPDKRQLTFLLVDGLVGTVVSEALWLWGCFLTSSLCATVALTLTIPMSMAADLALKRVAYPSLVYLGSIPMFCALLAIALLCRYETWDPVLDATRRLKPFIRVLCWPCRFSQIKSTRSARRLDAEQTESLLFEPTSEAGEEIEPC